MATKSTRKTKKMRIRKQKKLRKTKKHKQKGGVFGFSTKRINRNTRDNLTDLNSLVKNRLSIVNDVNKNLKINLHGDSHDTCAICGFTFLDVEKPRFTSNDIYKTKCGHVFHKQCIIKWCDVCNEKGEICTCPICRAEVELNPKRYVPPVKPVVLPSRRADEDEDDELDDYYYDNPPGSNWR